MKKNEQPVKIEIYETGTPVIPRWGKGVSFSVKIICEPLDRQPLRFLSLGYPGLEPEGNPLFGNPT